MKRYKLTRDTSGPEPRYRVDGIELFQPHDYPGSKLTGEPATRYTEADLDRMIARSKKGVKTFIGHNYPGSAAEGEVRGEFQNLRKETVEGVPTIVGDLVGADPLLALSLARGHYPHVSPEFSPRTMQMKGVAWLGKRDPFFKNFSPVRPDVDQATIATIKADAKEFAVRHESNDIPTALREDLEEGTVDVPGDLGGSKDDTKATLDRLLGLMTNMDAQLREVTAKQAASEEWIKLMKKGSTNPKPAAKKEPVAARESEEEDEDMEDPEKAALREDVAALRAEVDAAKHERVCTALRSDLNSLKAKYAISNETADAIVEVCAAIKDEKARKTKFAALTKGFREAPLEDAAPDANTPPVDVEASAKAITDAKVATMLREAADAHERKVIETAWKDLVAMRASHAKDTWQAFYIHDAEAYVRAQLNYDTAIRAD